MARFDPNFFVAVDDEQLAVQRLRSREWREVLLDGKDKIIRKGCVRQLVATPIFHGVVEVRIKALDKKASNDQG